MRVVLASQSPRRRELLSNIFDDFEIIVSDADESVPESLAPHECAVEIARRKLFDVRSRATDALIIAADTIVVLDGEILGKPRDRDDAFDMLSRLSGRTHTVYTGIAVSLGDRIISHAEATEVTFCKLCDQTILKYIATGEPMDKAGAYGIQNKGALFVEKICGDYFNVVGLPIHRLSRILAELGVSAF